MKKFERTISQMCLCSFQTALLVGLFLNGVWAFDLRLRFSGFGVSCVEKNRRVFCFKTTRNNPFGCFMKSEEMINFDKNWIMKRPIHSYEGTSLFQVEKRGWFNRDKEPRAYIMKHSDLDMTKPADWNRMDKWDEEIKLLRWLRCPDIPELISSSKSETSARVSSNIVLSIAAAPAVLGAGKPGTGPALRRNVPARRRRVDRAAVHLTHEKWVE